jgi:hypothetical protein
LVWLKSPLLVPVMAMDNVRVAFPLFVKFTLCAAVLNPIG